MSTLPGVHVHLQAPEGEPGEDLLPLQESQLHEEAEGIHLRYENVLILSNALNLLKFFTFQKFLFTCSSAC